MMETNNPLEWWQFKDAALDAAKGLGLEYWQGDATSAENISYPVDEGRVQGWAIFTSKLAGALIEDLDTGSAQQTLSSSLRAWIDDRESLKVFSTLLVDGIQSFDERSVEVRLLEASDYDEDDVYQVRHLVDVGTVDLKVSATGLRRWLRMHRNLGTVVASITLGVESVSLIQPGLDLVLDLFHRRIKTVDQIPNEGSVWVDTANVIFGEYVWALYLESVEG
jgi:hypothetical protein